MSDITLVKLVVAFGAHDTPIAHGCIDYQPNAYRADITDPNSPWLVEVPPHVAEKLIHNAGFYAMEETAPQFAGTARLYAPYGCSWGGVRYQPDEDDIVTVPSAAVADLLSFPPICPETARPEREPVSAELAREHDATLTAEIVRRLKEQGRAEAQAELDARDERIAELEAELRVAAEPAKGEEKPAAKSVKSAKP